ncbi:MAG: type II toxin-antitoxin system HicA family toxin [Candidatus Latescibacterota bacterium]|jgi:predicted RNA binding protein YcfA (HicA-like mRNA interferase family)
MGRLSGFTYREVTWRLRRLGFEFDRHARGSHEIWWSPVTRRRTTIPNHPGDLPEGTLSAILRQAGVTVDQFLDTPASGR